APDLHPPLTLLSRAKALYSALFHNSKPPVVFTLARGSDSARPQEAVLPLGADGPDLAAALRLLPPGAQYEIKLSPISGGPPKAGRCTWTNSQAQLQEKLQVVPGLYLLRVSTQETDSTESTPLGSTVTVLIVDAKDYRRAEAAFREASSAASAWEK